MAKWLSDRYGSICSGTQAEVIGFATSSVNLWGTAPSFWATLDAGR